MMEGRLPPSPRVHTTLPPGPWVEVCLLPLTTVLPGWLETRAGHSRRQTEDCFWHERLVRF